MDDETPTADPVPAETGGAGGVCTDHRCLRSDARLVKRLLGLGVIRDEEVDAILKRGFVLAASAKSPRNYRAAMSVPIEVAKLGLAMEKAAAPAVAVQVNTGAVAQVRIVELPANGRDSRPADTDDDDESPPRVEGTNGYTNGYTNGNGHAH